MQNFDTIIKNGTIVTASDTYRGDIGIKDGRITQIGLKLDSSCENIIDADGKYIFPGGIDPHTHMDMPFGGTFSSDDFLTGTKAAACGGTTTIVDFAVQPKGKTLKETTKIWREKADNKACIDYGIHISITDMNDEILEEMESIIKEGYSSFKLFMTYEGMKVEDDTLMKALIRARDKGGIICVHAENHYVIDYLVKKLLSEGKIEPKYHALSRPELCEGEAAGRAIKLAEICGAPLYIVHNTCNASVSEIERARNLGYPIMGETCPQYLLLSYENYEEEDFNGAKYVMSPPLRDKSNWEHIWKALQKGTLQVVATDHCPFFMEQKRMGINSFDKIPNGAPGVELRMALMYTYGVLQNKISLQKFVEVTSTNAAKIFGMYPQKGSIAVGSDADLVIFDPEKEIEVKEENLNENVDYTPYEGFKLKGYPVMTLLRGEIIAKDGKFVGKKGIGKFIKRGRGEIL
ncbi:dihydropyrimidinase [Clostridium cochlearium]|jgi:dihydropyrimidinase|uniref:Dihydropyrimidinase n=1 Tax=Clostridium cochlearium TaxID=1494 RepID=A0A240AGL1_CLOCO|nr:dihydropyrimidinase [Clostridium cochlearium]MBV1819865.1 dihydropyrimidinase [Bacteroidales bacterium MSK.15.36]NSJ91757.1 dihydropyrimidinase [Coprococcus sp. MSK.21.13]MBE6064903.1 dihydropyrimidinase [Clostridium cochlearium]MBU5270251.1 dihydropyrimidinase [Clostridium cochlearium]MCG4571547.1 dihydropyrimidinase [Clostridium cochlearium]